MLGYRRSDVPDGIGKLSSTLGGRAFVSGHLGGVTGTVALVHAALGGDFEGFVLNSRVSYPVWLGRLMLIPSVWVTWANGQYMRRYFGVNAEQAAASGLPRYNPSAGFKEINAGLAINYALTRALGLTAFPSVARNMDGVTDSPFVERRWQGAGVLGVTYTF
jgi:outer membrane protein